MVSGMLAVVACRNLLEPLICLQATFRGTVRMATTANLFTSFSAKKIGSGTAAAPVDGCVLVSRNVSKKPSTGRAVIPCVYRKRRV
jgi:hypothetical protein